ncbi:MAG: hypothetical protein ACREQ9_16500, partial [Candidatus Binatia bacterium]
LLCVMYRGAAAAAAPGGEAPRRGGVTFHVHRAAGATAVFWQEGEVACALVGDGDPEAVIALAYEKARRAGDAS